MTDRHDQRSTSDTQHVTDSPAPERRPNRRPIGAGVIFVLIVVGLFVVLLVGASVFGGSDLSPTEQQFVDNQRSSLDEDEALRYGNAICEMLDSGGEQFTVEWLAGVDDLSQAGMVRPNAEPISMYDARQIAAAADDYLCQ